MSIDFSTLQGVTIPEGEVTQIADASGTVLWSRAADTAAIYITGSGVYSGYEHTLASVTIDGVEYTSDATVEVRVGSTITLYVYISTNLAVAEISVDGTVVAQTDQGVLTSTATYDLTVTGNTAIALTTTGIIAALTYYGTISVTTSGGHGVAPV